MFKAVGTHKTNCQYAGSKTEFERHLNDISPNGRDGTRLRNRDKDEFNKQYKIWLKTRFAPVSTEEQSGLG